MFSCEFCEISKNTFFTEQLWATASVHIQFWNGMQLSQCAENKIPDILPSDPQNMKQFRGKQKSISHILRGKYGLTMLSLVRKYIYFSKRTFKTWIFLNRLDTFISSVFSLARNHSKINYFNPLAPIPQNSQTHSNNSSANRRRSVWVRLTILWNWP